MKSIKGLFSPKSKTKSPSDPKASGTPTLPPPDHPLAHVPLTAGFSGQFPTSFAIYYTGSTKNNKKEYFAITDEVRGKASPLYAFVFIRNEFKHNLNVFAGPDPSNSLILAASGIERIFRSVFLIALPPAPAPGGGGPAPNRLERLIYGKTSAKFSPYSFTAPVGADEHPETFEFRSTDRAKTSAENPYTTTLYRQHGNTGANVEDGEAVLSWVEEWEPEKKEARLGVCRFQGSGATGELGSYWTLVAAISLVRVIQNKWEIEVVAKGIIKAASGVAGAGIGMA